MDDKKKKKKKKMAKKGGCVWAGLSWVGCIRGAMGLYTYIWTCRAIELITQTLTMGNGDSW